MTKITLNDLLNRCDAFRVEAYDHIQHGYDPSMPLSEGGLRSFLMKLAPELAEPEVEYRTDQRAYYTNFLQPAEDPQSAFRGDRDTEHTPDDFKEILPETWGKLKKVLPPISKCHGVRHGEEYHCELCGITWASGSPQPIAAKCQAKE